MIPQLRRVLLAFTVILSLLVGFGSPASADNEEEQRTNGPTLEGPRSCDGDIVLDFNTRFINGFTASSETIAAKIPAGTYDLTIATYDGYAKRANADQPGERVELLGVMTDDLADNVVEAWGTKTARVVIGSELSEVTATHAFVSGPDSLILVAACLTEVIPTSPDVRAEIVVLCNDESPGTVYIQATINNVGNAEGEYLFASDNGAGPDIVAQSGTIKPGETVVLYGYPDALGSGTVFVRDGIVPGSSNSVIARASFDSDDCVDITDPTIEFKCVDEGRVAVAFNTDGADITEVRVNGEVVAHDGDLVVNSGDKVEVTTALGGQTATASAVAPECDEIGLQEPLIKFFCVGEDLVQWSVQNPNNFGELTVWVGGVETDATSGTIASGTEVQAVVNADGNFGPVQSDMADARAEECPPENEAVEATVEFLCVSPTEVAYTVTSDAFGLAVNINGEDVFPSGIVPVGTEITVTTYTEAMYSDELIVWTETHTAPECAPEATPEVTISTVCNADLTARDYTVTAPEGSTIVSVKVNGVTVGTSGTVYAGDVITVVASTASVYNDAEVITETFSMTVGDCELPVTGSTTATLLSMAGVLLIAGASLLLVRRKLA